VDKKGKARIKRVGKDDEDLLSGFTRLESSLDRNHNELPAGIDQFLLG
jgi:hypothetical protein